MQLLKKELSRTYSSNGNVGYEVIDRMASITRILRADLIDIALQISMHEKSDVLFVQLTKRSKNKTNT